MLSLRKITEVAVISSALTLAAVYIYLSSGGRFPGINFPNQPVPQDETGGQHASTNSLHPGDQSNTNNNKVIFSGSKAMLPDSSDEFSLGPFVDEALKKADNDNPPLTLDKNGNIDLSKANINPTEPAFYPHTNTEQAERKVIFSGSKSEILTLPPVVSGNQATFESEKPKVFFSGPKSAPAPPPTGLLESKEPLPQTTAPAPQAVPTNQQQSPAQKGP